MGGLDDPPIPRARSRPRPPGPVDDPLPRSWAGSVAAAVERLKGEAFNLVIADLRMEPLNGVDLLMLAQRYCPRCPVITVTAYGSAEARAEALEKGAADFLEKPLEAGQLQARIQQLLAGDGR